VKTKLSFPISRPWYRAGQAGRILCPSASIFHRAGQILRELRAWGRDMRRASLVGDVLIALTGRASGATVWTADAGDFEAIRAIEPFSLRLAAT
jgi:predicted nucleic acid-binding protein